jgi:hypothetical protein
VIPFNDIEPAQDFEYKKYWKSSYGADEPMNTRETALLTALAESTNVYFNFTS